MTRRGVASFIVLCLLVIGALFVTAPSARAVVGPKAITVDGDPSDWTGAVPVANTGAESNLEWVWNDTTGDDTGDGDYTYPKASDLNRTGLFDLTEFRVSADAANLYVLIKIKNLSNTWSGSDGFSTVAASLLIDTTRDGNGALWVPPNVNIAAGSGWEYWVKIAQTGWHTENAKIFDRSASKWAPIVNRANPATNSIEVSIPLAFIGKDGYNPNGATWRFMLVLGGFDGGGPNGFRDAMGARWCCDWQFGGGTDGQYDPNVVDIAFAATQAAQEAELASYTATDYATIASSADVTFGALGFTPDTTVPTISAVTVSPTFNSAQITWTTSEPANTTVRWGSASGSLTNVVSKDEFVTSHSVTLTGLSEQTTYYYRVSSADIADNVATTAEASFVTPAAPPSNIAAWAGAWFTWKDRTGDDAGDGNYVYPLTGLVDWVGRADLSWVNMTRTATAVHLNIKMNANPEAQWRQRMGTVAIFIDQDHRYDSGARSVGLVGTGAELTDPHPMNLSIAPNFAWEYMIVATFQNRSEVGDTSGVGEMFVFNNTWNAAQSRWSLIYLSTAPAISPKPDTGQIYAKNGNEVDIWLNRSVFGNTDNWTWMMASMLFDDAARSFDQGGIRQVRPTAGDWIGGGSNGPYNPNVYDLAFYATTPDQTLDLSNYTGGQWANLTRGVQVNFTAQWHRFVRAVPPTHSYAVTVSPAQTRITPGTETTITVTFTDNGAPVPSAQVALAFAPSSGGSLVGNTVKTTDANGVATFTFRAGSVTADTTVTFTATATNGTTTRTGTGTLTVAPPPPPPVEGPNWVLYGGVAVVVIIVIASIAILLRMRGKPKPPPEEGQAEKTDEPKP